jgi:hypothetical protein
MKKKLPAHGTDLHVASLEVDWKWARGNWNDARKKKVFESLLHFNFQFSSLGVLICRDSSVHEGNALCGKCAVRSEARNYLSQLAICCRFMLASLLHKQHIPFVSSLSLSLRTTT